MKNTNEATVLIVNSNPVIRNMIRDMLSGGGFSLQTAESREEGFNIITGITLEGKSVGLIIAELESEDDSNVMTTQNAKHLFSAKTLFTSLNAEKLHAFSISENGPDDILPMPFLHGELLEKVMHLLDSSCMQPA